MNAESAGGFDFAFECCPICCRSPRQGSGISTYGHGALRRIERFYGENAEIIDRYRVPTWDFDTNASTPRTDTRPGSST
jgi:hypothetical protein